MDRGAAPFERRAAPASFEARAGFLAAAGLAVVFCRAFALDLAFGLGWAFGPAFAARRLVGLAAAFVRPAALARAFVFGFPRVDGADLAADFAAALGRDPVAGRAGDFRLAAGLAVDFFRAAIPVLKSAPAACPLGRRSIWKRPLGGKPKGEKPHNPLKVKELQGNIPTTGGH